MAQKPTDRIAIKNNCHEQKKPISGGLKYKVLSTNQMGQWPRHFGVSGIFTKRRWNFGNQTYNAVKAFIASRNLVEDGLVGPKPWIDLNQRSPT